MKLQETDQAESAYLSPAEASRATGLSVRQLSRLADAGKLHAIRPGQHRRYRATDVAALIAGEPWDAA